MKVSIAVRHASCGEGVSTASGGNAVTKKTWAMALATVGTALAFLAMPGSAQAQQAFARNGLNLRAGPAGNYPVVARLGPGQPFQVLGCTGGYAWCDVVMPDGLRGWVYAPGIDYAYEDRRVPLATYGAVIGVPIVAFSIGSYWGNYYRDRPWYGESRWWGGRPPPPLMPGWRPLPPPRPAWQPRPWQGPPPGPAFRPGPGPRPPQFAPRPPQAFQAPQAPLPGFVHGGPPRFERDHDRGPGRGGPGRGGPHGGPRGGGGEHGHGGHHGH